MATQLKVKLKSFSESTGKSAELKKNIYSFKQQILLAGSRE